MLKGALDSIVEKISFIAGGCCDLFIFHLDYLISLRVKSSLVSMHADTVPRHILFFSWLRRGLFPRIPFCTLTNAAASQIHTSLQIPTLFSRRVSGLSGTSLTWKWDWKQSFPQMYILYDERRTIVYLNPCCITWH